MCDQQDGRAEFVGERGEVVEDLALHRHVECRRRFVGDEQLGFSGETDRDERALLHAAGELVRILRRALLRIAQAGLSEHLDGTCACLAALGRTVGDERLTNLEADAPHRVEVGVGILWHEADSATAHLLELTSRGLCEVLAVEQYFAAGHGAVAGQQSEYRRGGRRLTRAGFADDGDGLTGIHGESDAAHRGYVAPA